AAPGSGASPAGAEARSDAEPAAAASGAQGAEGSPGGALERGPLPLAIPRGAAGCWAKREYLAGSGAATRPRAAARGQVQAPLDARPLEGNWPDRDLLLAANVGRELGHIRARAAWVVAWATPCTSFGLLCQNCGLGARRASRPRGDDPGPAERRGNGLGHSAAAGFAALGEEGGPRAAENPRRPRPFRQLPLRGLMAHGGAHLAERDACRLGLGPLGSPSAKRKQGAHLLGNFPGHVRLEGPLTLDCNWQEQAALAAACAP
ncbi:unnamed protein product, partial [Prorocentrum cordatum]